MGRTSIRHPGELQLETQIIKTHRQQELKYNVRSLVMDGVRIMD